jgi:peptidoglycan/xylan/chitin deacetylase (PgdA/CDA1 family)
VRKRSLIERVVTKGRRILADRSSRHMVSVGTSDPIVSFTFDDAPITAFETGGTILGQIGARATYYVSLGLLDTETEVGPIASAADLARAVEDGHELGCHTFDHLDAWHVTSADYVASVHRNREALRRILPDAAFATFAYPKSGATATVKSALRDVFVSCRGGGQVANLGTTDLKLLKACFLDRRTGIDMAFIRSLVDANTAARGWLIFATHDVTTNPSPYGCTPEFLQDVAQYVSRSGALLLPVSEACSRLQSQTSS